MEKVAEEAKETVADILKQRLANPVYVTFFFWNVVFHWHFWYITMFVDQDLIFQKYGLLKSEYLLCTLSVEGFLGGLLVSGILTYLTVWKFPEWFLIKAQREDVAYRKENEIMRIEADKELSQKRKEAFEAQAAALSGEVKVATKKKEVAKTKTKEEVWTEEFTQLITSIQGKSNLDKFSELANQIYAIGGRVSVGGSSFRELSKEAVSFATAYELLETSTYESRSYLGITEKGKYFSRLMMQRSR